MYLMGQALFSLLLVEREFPPRSVRAIVLRKENAPVLGPLLTSVGKKSRVDIEGKKYPDADPSSMSESPGTRGSEMINWYHDQVGSTLYRKFPENKTSGQQFIHAGIVRDGPKEKVPGEDIPKGQDIIGVHARSQSPHYRLGMYLMAQPLFGAEPVRQKFKPRSIRSVALCELEDSILQPLLKEVGKKVRIDMEVVGVPENL